MHTPHSKSRAECRTSQGVRTEWMHSTTTPSKPTTSYSRRTEAHRAQTPLEKAARIQDSKKALFEACNQIDKVFPRQRYSTKNSKLNLSEIKSEGIRISIIKRTFDDDIKDSMIRLAQKIHKELEKGREIVSAYEDLKTQNFRLKDSPTFTKDHKENGWCLYPQGRKFLKSAGRCDPKAYDSKVVLQNSKLECMNRELMKMIEKSQDEKSKQKPIQNEGSSLSDWRVEEVRNKISYLELKLSTQEKNNSDLLSRIQEKEMVLKETQKTIQRLLQENLKLREQKTEWMQRSLMQLQDHRYHHPPKPAVKEIAEVFQYRKIQNAQKQEPRRNSNLQVKYNIQRRILFGYEVDFFKSIRTHYLENKITCYNMNIRWRADELGLNYQKILLDNSPDEELFPLPQLSFYRPSFYSFVEHLHQKDHDNYELSRSLIQKMRCIMQSKLNEFLIFDNPDQYTHFPEFVFAWFKKYYFDSDRNCIVESMCSEESGYEAFKFYKDLMNVKLDQTWQVVTFREFLLEELSLQDLYFYLQCQHMLFRKAGITEEIQYIGEFLILVKYSVVKSVLDVVLSQFESWNIEFLINKMNEKIILVKSQQFIEAAFFLRCLLEYYKIERMNRCRYIRKVARQLKQNQKFPILNYLDCMKVLSKFPDITQSNRLSIYRSCYSVGRGVITPEIIFTVCTENRVFLKHLKIKSFYKLPIQNSRSFESGTLFCIQPPHPYLYKIFTKMKKMLAQGSSFSRKVMGLGVEDLSNKVEFYRKYFLQWKSFNDNSILKCKHFLHFVRECLSIVSSVNYHLIHQLLSDQGKLSNKISINLDENQMGQIYSQDTESTVQVMQNTIGLLEWKVKLQRLRENTSAKKIQRMVRKKFIQPYVQIYNVMFDKVKKIKYFGNSNQF